MNPYEQEIAELIKISTGKETKLSVPPNPSMGDFAYACFELAKEKGKNPGETAKELVNELPDAPIIEKIQAMGPYVNFYLDKTKIAEQLLNEIYHKGNHYGQSKENGKSIVIDFSSPNIAKPFGIHHLRSTVIGNSLYKIHKAMGYKVIGVNHLGDWGTQFGKLITAYKLWGDEKELEERPINYLLDLYVKFHREIKQNEKLEEEAREWFKKLEEGDEGATKLWELFRKESIKEFNRVYDLMQVTFDNYHGEAFFNDKLPEIIKKLEKSGITEISDGAMIVDLSDINVAPLMVVKSNGTSTYHTRDLAAAIFRAEEYNPEKVLYVVDYAQTLHFKQLFTVLGMLGYDMNRFEHVAFGRMHFEDGSMSTREGNMIFLEEVLNKSIEMVRQIIEEKNPGLEKKEEVAKWVGVGAIIFGDLVNDRNRDVTFSWERVLDFEGETGPYLQYTHARARSILRKSGHMIGPDVKYENYKEAEEHKVIMQLSKYSQAISDSARNNKPHILAHYLIVLAQTFNEFYQKCPVISEDEGMMASRLLLVNCAAQVLKNGLWLLGIHAPEEM